jgi:hypothetical protein
MLGDSCRKAWRFSHAISSKAFACELRAFCRHKAKISQLWPVAQRERSSRAQTLSVLNLGWISPELANTNGLVGAEEFA